MGSAVKLLLLCLVFMGLAGCRSAYYEPPRAKLQSVLGATFVAKEAKVELDELQSQYTRGLLSTEEYSQKRAEILRRINQSSPTWTEKPRKRPRPPIDDLRHP